jgi:endonuclease YncB( thermonuclease family)
LDLRRNYDCMTTDASTSDERHPRRWGRVVDVVEGGVLYTEDAERLVLAGIEWPVDEATRVKAEHQLSELVGDKIVFYEVVGADQLGRLLAEVWVEERSVNNTLRNRI